MPKNTRYYDLLELDERERALQGEEFQTALRKKYKKLAMACHPDRFPDNEEKRKEAEDKFKEISVAYNTLNDPEKRLEYDTYGEGGARGQGFGMSPDAMREFMERMMSNMGFEMGFGAGGAARQARKGMSHRVRMELSLEELYNGVHKTVKFKRLGVCPECGGSGAAPDGQWTVCPACCGTGQMTRQNGYMLFSQTCPFCGGEGRKLDKPCRGCGGEGLTEETATAEFDVPAGTVPGQTIVMPGMGSAARDGGENGDLYLVVTDARHPVFERNGLDLYVKAEVPLLDCLTGTSVEVSGIDGKRYSVKIKENTRHRDTLKMGGKGMKDSANGRKGDMYVVVEQKMPKSLGKKARKLVDELKGMEEFKNPSK